MKRVSRLLGYARLGMLATTAAAGALVAHAGCSGESQDALHGSQSLGAGPMGRGNGVGGRGARLPSGACAQGQAATSPVTPTVWLVVDGSGSMGEAFGGSSRWRALRSALMDAGGVVQTLQAVVRFGLVIYNGPQQGPGGGCFQPGNINIGCGCFSGFERACCEAACGGMPAAPPMPLECPQVSVLDPALANYAAISAAYPQVELGGSTPTDRALERIVSSLPVVNKRLPDDRSGPVYVILATDGAPNDTCGMGGMGGGVDFQPAVAQRVVEVVRNGVAMGMRMFVISLAGGDARLRTHLQEVAEIGSPGQAPFEPSSRDELVAALQSIVSGATCQVALDGMVQSGQECSGEVALNGQPLACDAANGWRLVNSNTLQLTGSACQTFLASQSLVDASFPCGVFIPQ